VREKAFQEINRRRTEPVTYYKTRVYNESEYELWCNTCGIGFPSFQRDNYRRHLQTEAHKKRVRLNTAMTADEIERLYEVCLGARSAVADIQARDYQRRMDAMSEADRAAHYDRQRSLRDAWVEHVEEHPEDTSVEKLKKMAAILGTTLTYEEPMDAATLGYACTDGTVRGNQIDVRGLYEDWASFEAVYNHVFEVEKQATFVPREHTHICVLLQGMVEDPFAPVHDGGDPDECVPEGNRILTFSRQLALPHDTPKEVHVAIACCSRGVKWNRGDQSYEDRELNPPQLSRAEIMALQPEDVSPRPTTIARSNGIEYSVTN